MILTAAAVVCRVETSQVVKPADRPQPTSKRRRSRQPQPEASDLQEDNEVVEQYNPVHCALCDTEVGLRELPPSGVYHLFNVIPSNA